MEYRSCPQRALLLLAPAALLLLILISIPSTDAASSAVIDIEQTDVFVDVSPGSFGVETIDVTVRSSSARNVILDIHYELNGPLTWSVDGQDQIYMEPLSKKSFQVDIIVPSGELASREGELTISAVVEGEPALDVGSDSVQISIQEFRAIEPVLEDEYLMDLPSSGSVDLSFRNTGNVGISYLLVDREENRTLLDILDLQTLEPGEEGSISFAYDMGAVEVSGSISLSAMLDDGIELDDIVRMEFIREGELFHLLFRPGPFLVLLPGLDLEDDTLSVFSLGGDIGNIGLEMVEGPEDAYVETGPVSDLDNLDREMFSFTTGGFYGTELLKVRAYGYNGDVKVISNTVSLMADGGSRSSGPIISSGAVIAGGSAAGAVTMAAGTAAYLYSASEVFRYKWLLLSLVPLYSMTKGEKVLDHFFRGRLFEYIKENPGVTFTALKEHFEVNNGTLTYHLHKLEREELITYRNLGKYKLFYADGMRIKGCEVVISPLDKDILEIVSGSPGMTSKQVISLMGSSRSQRTLSRHIKQLERKGFLVVERSHGARRLFVSDDLERVLMPHTGVVEVAEVIGSEA